MKIKTSVKSGNFRPTKKGAGMTEKGVRAYRKANPGSKLKTAVPPSLKVTVPLPAPTPITKPLSLALEALIVVVVLAAAPLTLISLSKAMIYLPYATVTLFEPTIVQPAVVLYTRIAASPTESKVIVVPPAKVVGVNTAVSPAALSATYEIIFT